MIVCEFVNAPADYNSEDAGHGADELSSLSLILNPPPPPIAHA